jgi:hypothetical protein
LGHTFSIDCGNVAQQALQPVCDCSKILLGSSPLATPRQQLLYCKKPLGNDQQIKRMHVNNPYQQLARQSYRFIP